MRGPILRWLTAAAACIAAMAPGLAAPSMPGDRAAIAHAVDRLTFGATRAEVERAGRIGLATWIDEQLSPARIDNRDLDRRLAGFETLRLTIDELARDYIVPAERERMERRRVEAQAGARPGAPQPADARQPSEAQRKERAIVAELSEAKILRAVYSERQLEEVLVDFWFNHFNVFANKGRTRGFVTAYERDAIRPHVFGRFRDLLEATAKSPAMLFYLDNWMSSAPEGAPTLAPDRANPPPAWGRRRRPSPAGMPDVPRPPAPRRRARGLNENYARELLELHTLGVDGGYTQQDIVEVARAFTGWTLDRSDRGAVRFAPAMHDAGAKRVLGQTIRAGGGEADVDRVLDILAAHPSTARFIATKLARRFVSDHPPAALVDRAAARFTRTQGDLRDVVRTIVTSPEFFSAAARAAKVKTPLEFVASALRATGAEMASAMPVVRALGQLGMPVYQCQPPTGYDDSADTWVSSGALVNRMNFALELAGGRLRGITLPASDASLERLRADLAAAVLHDRASSATLSTLGRASTREQTIALAIGSPEFQRR